MVMVSFRNRKDKEHLLEKAKKMEECASSQEQFLNTIVHEAKHVQSHICKYYEVDEDSEQAAYLIGYIVQNMHKVFKNMISTGTK